MNILAIIVAYNPDRDLLERNIASFAPYVSKILIWRNSLFDLSDIRLGRSAGGSVSPGSVAVGQAEVESVAAGSGVAGSVALGKIEICGDGANAGIGKALNYAVDYAQRGGYTHLLTMDQDSVWENFQEFLGGVEEYEASGKEPGLYGPAVYTAALSERMTPAESLITSGMLVPMAVYDRIGGYDEKFFVDGIDLDFSYKAKEAGLPLWTVGGCHLVQRFGQKERVNLLWFHPVVNNYSAFRLRGIYRNQLIVIRRYKSAYPLKKRYIRHHVLNRIPRILLFEKDRWNKCKAIFGGIWAGLTDRLD